MDARVWLHFDLSARKTLFSLKRVLKKVLVPTRFTEEHNILHGFSLYRADGQQLKLTVGNSGKLRTHATQKPPENTGRFVVYELNQQPVRFERVEEAG